MMKTRVLLLGLIAALTVFAAAPAGAGAAAVYKYKVMELGPGAWGDITGLDSTKQTTFRILRGGVEQYRDDQSSGSGSLYFSHAVESGDVFEVYQYPPADPVLPDPPLVAATEYFTVPPLTASLAAGNPVVSGAAPDGFDVRVNLRHPCGWGIRDAMEGVRSPGAYSATFPFPVLEGGTYSLTATNALGDKLHRNGTAGGDGRCIEVDALLGTSTSVKPYEIDVSALDYNASPTVRTVLRRSGAALADENDDDLDLTADKRPLPGDVIEVYRPKDAPAPAYAYTVPAFGGVFDVGNNLAAIDVEAGSVVGASACRKADCGVTSERASRAFAAGRTIFSFGEPLGDERAFDILAGDYVSGWWVSSDEKARVWFDLAAGDLTPPVGKVKLSSRLDVGKLAKRLRFKLNSNEAGSVSAALTTPKLPKRQKGSAAAKKPVTLAIGGGNVVAGNNTLSLKPTRGGKKAIKRIVGSGRSVKGTLTITLRDAAGNATNVVKNVKIKVRQH